MVSDGAVQMKGLFPTKYNEIVLMVHGVAGLLLIVVLAVLN